MTGAKFRFGPDEQEDLLLWIRPVLELGQRQGIIALGPLDGHVFHALGFALAWHGETGWNTAVEAVAAPAVVVDLGSGAGLPALVLAGVWPESQWTLTETREKRSEFLHRAVHKLGLGDRVNIWAGDVQDLPWPGHDGPADLVTARAFGKPALVAECAAGLLGRHGRAIVSEPDRTDRVGAENDHHNRWPEPELLERGLQAATTELSAGTFATLTATGSCERLVRRNRRAMERSPWYVTGSA